MVTLLLQAAVGILTLLFGIASLWVLRRAPGAPEPHRAAWSLTGWVFVVLGVSTVIQNCIAAPWAFTAGPGSQPWEIFLRYSPVGNHSRTFVVVAYGALMASLVPLSRLARGHYGAVALVVSLAAMAAGAAFGWREGPLVRATHYTALAISDSAELIVLFAALLAGVAWNTMDRLLWIALAVFVTHELLDVGFYSGLAWAGVPGAWAPPARYMHLYASIGYVLMTGIAVHRARLGARAVKVPGLLEPPAQPAASLLR